MTPPNESPKQSKLDILLAQSERELQQQEVGITQNATEYADVDRIVSDTQTQTALAIERDIVAAEMNNTLKLEKGIWIGAHIVCLPFFYDEYTIRARLSPELQQKYNQAIITTCGRFKAMGKKGTALVSPITNYIRNYADFSPKEREELETELIERVYEWLNEEVSLTTQPRSQSSRSLQVIMEDIEHAERIFENVQNTTNYMEGEVRLAVIQALRHTDFLPAAVKYHLLNELQILSKEQLFDIGTFLLWEIRKSSFHHNKLLMIA
ncbi:MAG: hypothetical protein NTZ55_01985 [Candidatus Roizmanbacteria bacterium]|nr:hypothetical protein [Candidatus Roizmanbacteria bacterium]